MAALNTLPGILGYALIVTVLNPIFMVPYVLNALLLTATTYGLMTGGLIRRPFINVPWTTPPILGRYRVTGGDWRAAVWGVASIGVAMAVHYRFAPAATTRRGGEIRQQWFLNRGARRSGELKKLFGAAVACF